MLQTLDAQMTLHIFLKLRLLKILFLSKNWHFGVPWNDAKRRRKQNFLKLVKFSTYKKITSKTSFLNWILRILMKKSYKPKTSIWFLKPPTYWSERLNLKNVASVLVHFIKPKVCLVVLGPKPLWKSCYFYSTFLAALVSRLQSRSGCQHFYLNFRQYRIYFKNHCL